MGKAAFIQSLEFAPKRIVLVLTGIASAIPMSTHKIYFDAKIKKIFLGGFIQFVSTGA